MIKMVNTLLLALQILPSDYGTLPMIINAAKLSMAMNIIYLLLILYLAEISYCLAPGINLLGFGK